MQDPLKPEKKTFRNHNNLEPSLLVQQKPHHLHQSNSQIHSLQQEIEWYKAPVKWKVKSREVATAPIEKRKKKKTENTDKSYNYLACHTTVSHKHPIPVVCSEKPISAVFHIFVTSLAK